MMLFFMPELSAGIEFGQVVPPDRFFISRSSDASSVTVGETFLEREKTARKNNSAPSLFSSHPWSKSQTFHFYSLRESFWRFVEFLVCGEREKDKYEVKRAFERRRRGALTAA